MENSLRKIFKAPYNRDAWRQTLAVILGTENVKYHLTPHSNNLTESQQKIAQKVFNLGFIRTAEGYQLPVFEVMLAPNIVIERNRVTVNNLIKNIILKDAREGAIAVFYYPDHHKSEWRFSFISPGSEDSYFDELEAPATNPKRFTYVFGMPEEEHRTAAQRFAILAKSNKKLDDFFKAFDVEKLSKQFFDEYKKHYEYFVEYLNRSTFKKVVFDGDEKAIRDFVKKLLGRIIFLYFVQKKGWLGASTTDYKDGDKNFLQNLFIQSGKNENFYPIWLSKLFFETLNNPDRPEDDFIMPDGRHVKIPFLNGGLFEKEKVDESLITFPADLFDELFTFLNRYNFTIYENSPEDHTIAVDPEMLGHIFENLLEDNKDKGTYYTPKEIVHYMTQESLIEYLHTHLPEIDRKKIEILVKNKIKQFSDDILDKIDQLLDKVKICDPAIGSGAFPMGLLQEIYALKELIVYEKGYVIASPARVKERIIQNSIYGVDIEQGAVDIARLRFWLSLVVDEDQPRPLPNLDYKIVVGDSLVSRIEIDNIEEVVEIDWDLKSSVGKADEYVKNIRNLLNEIVKKQKQFFHPNSKNKEKLKTEITDLKLELLINQLKFEKEKLDNKTCKDINFLSSRKTKRQIENERKLDTYTAIIRKLEILKKKPQKSFKHFDWKLDFPEVLNPAIAGDNPGFDIVIGNPPWVSIIGKHGIEESKRNKIEILKKKYDGNTYSPNMFEFFLKGSLKLPKRMGIFTFIIPDRLGFNKSYLKFRKTLLEEYHMLDIVYKWRFETVIADTMTIIIKNEKLKDYDLKIQTRPTNPKLNFKKSYILQRNDILFKGYNNKQTKEIIDYIKFSSEPLLHYCKSTSGFGGKSSLLTDFKLNNNQIKVIKGKNIEKYKIRDYSFFEFKDENITGRTRDEKKLSVMPKILIRKTGNYIVATYENKGVYPEQSLYFLYDFKISPKFLLGILNSELITWYYLNELVTNEDSTPQLKNYDLDSIPIKRTKIIFPFELLVDYILFIKTLEEFEIINKFVPNSHIAQQFEEIIDAMVFELYFAEEFKKAGIAFIQYVERDFKPIEGLSREEKKKIVHQAYQLLRQADHPIRNNLKLMDIRLKDLVMPMKTVY